MKKEYRIKKNEEIEQLIKIKQTVGSKYIVIYFRDGEKEHFRFAVSAGKKLGNAPTRNLAKRRVREIVHGVKETILLKDFLIVVKPKANELGFQDLKKEIEKLLKRAKITRG